MSFQFALPLALAAALGLPQVVAAQSIEARDLAVGKLLVSPRDSPDPHFAKTVVLVVQLDENGAMGLMINRRTNVPISRALDPLKAAHNRSDPIYLGGPVELSTVVALLRSTSRPEEARKILTGVYLVSTRSLLEKELGSGAGPGEFHAYAGYCGWGAGQLQGEMSLKAWYILDADARLVFDSDPDSVWPRLIARIEQNVARGRPITDTARETAYAGRPGAANVSERLPERDRNLRDSNTDIESPVPRLPLSHVRGSDRDSRPQPLP